MLAHAGLQERVWHLAHELSLEVIEALSVPVVRRIPGLRTQAVSAATSVAANLAVFKYDMLLVDDAQDLNRCQQALAKI